MENDKKQLKNRILFNFSNPKLPTYLCDIDGFWYLREIIIKSMYNVNEFCLQLRGILWRKTKK